MSYPERSRNRVLDIGRRARNRIGVGFGDQPPGSADHLHPSTRTGSQSIAIDDALDGGVGPMSGADNPTPPRQGLRLRCSQLDVASVERDHRGGEAADDPCEEDEQPEPG